MRRMWSRWWGAALVMALVVGCREAPTILVPVRGCVTLDEKPVPGAEVVLHPLFDGAGWLPVATTEADGTFAAGTFLAGDGAPAGPYKVTITWHPDATDEQSGPNRLPDRYARAATTDLEVQVGTTPDEFHLLQLRK